MEKSGQGNRLKKFFVTTLAMFAFAKKTVGSKVAGSSHGGGSWGGAPIYHGKVVRFKHFNKKRNGKRLRRKHRKAA